MQLVTLGLSKSMLKVSLVEVKVEVAFFAKSALSFTSVFNF